MSLLSMKPQPHPHWKSKLPQLEKQCDSCPFRTGNNSQLKAMLNRLRAKLTKLGPLKNSWAIAWARMVVLEDMKKGGDFACHHTAYDGNTEIKPRTEWRQCPGATRFYTTGQLSPPNKPYENQTSPH